MTLPDYPYSAITATLSLGAIAFGLLRIWRFPRDEKRARWFVLSIFATIAYGLAMPYCMVLAAKIRPVKYDQYIYWADGLLGFQPSFHVGRFLAHRPVWALAAEVAYDFIGWVGTGVIACYIWGRKKEELGELIRAVLLNIGLGFAIYLIIPVAGPVYAFKGFPFEEPAMAAPAPIALAAAPNGIPSLHLATALMILWFLRHWIAGRIFGSLFLLMTILATLGTGQHYLLDLIVAVPYTVLVLHLASPEWWRRVFVNRRWRLGPLRAMGD